jgi:hypothetical protein
MFINLAVLSEKIPLLRIMIFYSDLASASIVLSMVFCLLSEHPQMVFLAEGPQYVLCLPFLNDIKNIYLFQI